MFILGKRIVWCSKKGVCEMTLTPGERKLYGFSGMVYLTEKEKKEVEEFHKQFEGQFVMNEQKT
jgi:hypothetical protein